MRLPIRILCRTDIDWTSMAASYDAAVADGRGLPRPSWAEPGLVKILERVESHGILNAWDEMFATSIFAFRARLNEITLENLASVSGARVSVGLSDFLDWYRDPADEMIYSIDDDDYFSDALANTAPEVDETTALVFWPHVQYAYRDDGSPELSALPSPVLMSNNWGVRKSFLTERFTEVEAQRVLTNHSHASVEIARALGIEQPGQAALAGTLDLRVDRARWSPESYGVSLKHVGSLLNLLRAANNDDIAPLARPELNASVHVPSELEWAEPWIRQAEEAFRSLTA